MKRMPLPNWKKIRVLPKSGVDAEASIKSLHLALGPFHANVIQNRGDRYSNPTFVSVNGGYTVQLKDDPSRDWNRFVEVVGQCGFVVDPASMTDPKPLFASQLISA